MWVTRCITCGVPQGLVLGTLLFLFFFNDLPKSVKDKSISILFADDTRSLLFHSNPADLNININTLFKILNDWFQQNLLSLNFTKNKFTSFTTKNNNQIEISISYDNNSIPTTTYYHFHHSIYSHYYCLLLIIMIILFQIMHIMAIIPDKEMIYICPR
jgi:hypothetical protein